jgi:hypothetical protein
MQESEHAAEQGPRSGHSPNTDVSPAAKYATSNAYQEIYRITIYLELT